MDITEYKPKKAGRPFKYLPAELENKVSEYKQWAANQTFEKVVFNPKTGEQTSIFLKCPLTIQQFCLYIGISYKTFKQYFNCDYGEGINEYSIEISEQISTIFAHVHEYIQQNQFAGAILNEYNGNIVARINGLNDTINVDQQVNVVHSPVSVSNKIIDLTSEDYNILTE